METPAGRPAGKEAEIILLVTVKACQEHGRHESQKNMNSTDIENSQHQKAYNIQRTKYVYTSMYMCINTNKYTVY